MTTTSNIDLDLLLKRRLIVARFGEMDLGRWWNTTQLGSDGAQVLKRGFPRTHFFAQARSVFAVASHRTSERLDPLGDVAATSVTLWRLPAEIEEQFDARWEDWLDNAGNWSDLFLRLQRPQGDLVSVLLSEGAVSEADLEAHSRLERRVDGPRVRVATAFAGSVSEVAQLALGFAHGAPGELVAPYAGLPK
ncbi:BrxE family protein [Actinoplanes subtropicus]|uniref:BrxE family protein n=1 Tax=Actinoplanes subtropicus TaxID=543632 RepID=UPI0004C39708|nr:BrxE family protein [Actinoplanes subtropicus]